MQWCIRYRSWPWAADLSNVCRQGRSYLRRLSQPGWARQMLNQCKKNTPAEQQNSPRRAVSSAPWYKSIDKLGESKYILTTCFRWATCKSVRIILELTFKLWFWEEMEETRPEPGLYYSFFSWNSFSSLFPVSSYEKDIQYPETSD